MKNISVLVTIMAVVFATTLFGQDPGVADTVRLGSDSVASYGRVMVPVYLNNDEAISSIVIPLLINGYSGWATFDSVSFVGSRLADPSILDVRQGLVVETDTLSMAKIIVQIGIGTGNELPAGSGKLCELWFEMYFGGVVELDSTTINSNGSLELTDAAANSFSPQFEGSQITVACDYIVGDADGSGFIGSLDILRIYKCLLGHYWVSAGPLQCFDLTCDR